MSIGTNLEGIFSLDGKVVMLTGATGGIGFELARGLALAGATMALCDLSSEKIDSMKTELFRPEVHKSFDLDVSDMAKMEGCVDAVLAEFGRIDVLINCAGINKREGFLDVEESTYDRIMDINLKGLFFITQKVVRDSMRKTGGKIINIGSINTTGMLGGVSVYGATKSAVYALTRSMAMEWAKFNIQANCLAPGHILTQLTQVTWDHPTRAPYLRERIAMERPGNPEELVGITILLASQASSYMTGQLYDVDGGALAGGKPWDFDTKY